MNKMLKTFISCGLSFLFMSATFHVDLHYQDNYDGYSICDISCDEEKHHSISHQCEKCLNKTNRLIAQEFMSYHPMNIEQRFTLQMKILKIKLYLSIYTVVHPQVLFNLNPH